MSAYYYIRNAGIKTHLTSAEIVLALLSNVGGSGGLK